jgi:MFS family permease
MPCGKNSKAYSTGLFVALGGFLLGYHTGVISGVLMMRDFEIKMNLIKCPNNTCRPGDINTISGSIVGVLLFGGLLGSLIGGQTSDRFSRKYSISFFSFTFTIGVAIQTASFDLLTLLIGRVISGKINFFSINRIYFEIFLGISIGALSMIVPIYHSEIATTKIRGRMITLQQVAITIGIAISFWINICK